MVWAYSRNGEKTNAYTGEKRQKKIDHYEDRDIGVCNILK
jgi:hypothetical protein